jgi:serine/threonine protein kinase
MNTILIVLALCLLGAIVVIIVLLARKGPSRQSSGPPTHLGPYHNLTLLSDKGGMAKIYKAYNIEAKRDCVLKVLRSDLLGDADAVKKFRREGEILQKIKQALPEAPVIRVFTTGTISTAMVELPFIEMEYIPGNMDLSDYLKQHGRMGPEAAEKVVVQIIRALAAAHDLGAIHRDMKPGNILLLDGDPGKVVVCDFGVAKQVDAKSVTMGGYGTAAYMSPEQCETGDNITTATDIYSLGVIFYELLTGKQLFEDDNPFVVMKRHQEEDPTPFVSKNIPENCRSLLSGMLNKAPEDRPGLNDVLAGLSSTALQVPGYRGLEVEPVIRTYKSEPGSGFFSRRNVLAGSLAGLLVILLGALGMEQEKKLPILQVARFGTLYLTSTPSGADVFIDGERRGKTPVQLKKVAVGNHLCLAKLRYHQDVSAEISLEKGVVTKQHLEFGKGTGKVTVFSTPDQADVFLDGQLKGVTPLRLDNVKKGTINLEIKKDHYSTVKRNLVVKPSLGETTVDVHLESLYGSLVVKSSPRGATVFVDGKEKGLTPLNLENVEKGLHIVKVAKHCFSVVEKKVDIIVSMKTDIDVHLENLCGSLVVKSLPSGATVFVDGKEKGVTLLRLDNVRKGNLNIKLIKKGFETESRIITVKPSKKNNFFVKLRQPIVSSDGRFVDHRNGIVTDTKTGLMWTREDSYVHLGKYLNWEQSKSYLNKLSTGGYSDWRLPAVAELKEIYEIKKSNTDKDGDIIHIDPIFSSGGTFWNWSSEEQGECCAKIFLLIDGSAIKNDRMFSYERGVRAVRP